MASARVQHVTRKVSSEQDWLCNKKNSRLLSRQELTCPASRSSDTDLVNLMTLINIDLIYRLITVTCHFPEIQNVNLSKSE